MLHLLQLLCYVNKDELVELTAIPATLLLTTLRSGAAALLIGGIVCIYDSVLVSGIDISPN